jgi:hypothetical protein
MDQETPGLKPVFLPDGEEKRRDVRFCPYCFLQQFDMAERGDLVVYCEMCGVDIEVRSLEKL